MIHIPVSIVVVGGYTILVSGLLYLSRNIELSSSQVRHIHTFIR